MPILNVTAPGSVLSVLIRDREISDAQLVAILNVLAEEALFIKARTLSNAETADIAVTASPAEPGGISWAQIRGGYDYTRWTKTDSFDNRDDLADDFVFYRLRYENPDEDGMLEIDVTPTLIRQGVALIVTNDILRDDLTKQVLDAVRGDPEDVDIDSEAADCIVQGGIFGKVVFG